MKHRHFIASLLLFFALVKSYGQEQISTWPFAEKIGMRGVQFQVGFLSPVHKPSNVNDLIIKVSPEEYKNRSTSELLNPNTAESPMNGFAQLRLSAVFLPFRHNANSTLKKAEWQSGLEFLAHSNFIYSRNSNDDYVCQYFLNNRSLYWYNSLFIEHKLLFNKLKIYGGLGLGVTLVPNYYITREDLLEMQQVNTAKFGCTPNATAGLKLSTGCRTNLYLEYQAYEQVWFMEGITLARLDHGLSFGVRYKFNKPEPTESEEKGNPVFW